MTNASVASWKRLLLPVSITGLSLWLAYGVIATGMAGYHERNGDGGRALRWREASPAALALEAERLMGRGDRAAAETKARQALEQSGLRVDALRLLALAASAGGREDEALALMSRAGRLNPRDGDAQGWLFERALARGDYRRAVSHADILMRRSLQTRAPLSSTLVALLGDREARAALVERLSIDPPWRGTFLSIATRKGADAGVAALFLTLKRTRSPVTDEEAAAFFVRMMAEKKYRQAKGYFDAFVGRQGRQATLVYDGGFSGRPGPPPLNWQALSVQGGKARLRSADGAPLGSLHVSHDGFSSSDPLVRQLILLSPGAYWVGSRIWIDDPVASGRFKLQIACLAGPRLVSMTLRGAPGSWVGSQSEFTVPSETCDAQLLLITPVTGDRREIVDMAIDDIVVQRAATAPPSREAPGITP